VARIGWVSCGVCGNPESSVSQNATETLSVQCHKCQFSGFAKAGTKGARLIRANLKTDDDQPAPVAPAAAATPKQAPAKKTANSAFDMANL
jgi:hypothetical protein